MALVESGNYLNAALDLGIAQSTLSKRIMALETELGIMLVDRSRRRIAITEAGYVVLSQARRILSTQREMLRELSALGASHPPVVTLLTIPVLAAYDIPSLLGRFREIEPGIDLRVVETEAKDILPGLQHGNAELGIMRGAFVDTGRFGYAPLYDDEAVVVLPREHPLGSEVSLDLIQLKHERFILMDKQTLQLDFFMTLCAQSGFQPEIVHTSTHADNIVNMVASGLGVSLLPRRVAEFPEDAGITIVPLRNRISMEIGIVWFGSTPRIPPLQRLLDCSHEFKII